MRSSRLQYALLALVAVGSLIFYLTSVAGSLDEIYGRNAVRLPLHFGYRLNVISGNTPEGYQAGLRWGDPVLAINGRPFTGYAVLMEELRKSHPGAPLAVTFIPNPPPPGFRMSPEVRPTNVPGHPELTRPGAPRTASIQLQPATPQRPTFFHLLTELYFLVLFFPLGCLLLAFWVVAARPRDKNAWFMLGILVYFASIFGRNADYWGGALFALNNFWAQASINAGPLAIMLFGIYFPERETFDERFPWVKWLLVAAAAIFAPLNFAWAYGFGFNFASVHWLAPIMLKYNRVQMMVFMVAISIYFFSLARKLGLATRPDERRRLKILYWGSTAGNFPLFVIVLFSLFTGRDIGDGVPGWIFLTALLIFTLFPISLAYVVVVHRALELRILLRQGTKYALARTSIWLIRIVLIIGISTSITRLLSHHPFRQQDVVPVLIMGALFLVFRLQAARRLSQWIDRKFFREAYSSEQILAELAAEAQSFTDSKALMETVAGCIARALHVDRIAILLRSGDVFRLQFASGLDLGSNLMLDANSETITNLARSKGPTTVYPDNPEAWILAATDAERAALLDLGAEVLIPLPGRNRLIGVLALGPKRSEEPYSRSDRGLLQSVALHTGLAIENSELVRTLASEAAQRERLNREIEIAREVQERMFPQSRPLVPGVDFAGYCRPAQGVGGDYYDFFELKERPGRMRSIGLAIGDVSGKGISASLLMASLRASLRGVTRTSGDDLAAVLKDINQLVYEASTSNRYATFFYAQYDPQERLLSYVNAGHNAPVVLRRNGASGNEILRLEACGPVIGLLPDADYQQENLHIQPDDILVAFTDGISESMALTEEEWGEERMIACLCSHADLCADKLLNALMDEATLFAGEAPQFDDMTLLVFKFGAIAKPETARPGL
jgi:sigma-B regulation protein RsbU (phosphoserine phosphatase)